MTERIFQRDTVELDAAKIEHYIHDVFGPVTVFKDVPIARAIVQEYDNGRAYKPGKELWDAAWTAEGRWAIAGRHPDTYVILNRDDIHGRTVNARPTKSLLDPETRRPMDRGIIVDLEVFDNLVPPNLLKDMASGKKTNVSIGFSFDEDKTPGVVEDEDDKSIMGAEYEFVQRNITIDHTAFGLEQGRCPMPLCGIGADEIKVAVDPFAGYETFEACVKDIMKQNPDYTRKQAEGTCAVIEQRSKEKHKSDVEGNINMESLTELNSKVDEILSVLKPAEDIETEEEVTEDYPSTEYSHPLSCICRECGYTLQGSQGAKLEKHCTEYKCPNCDAQMFRRNAPESGEEIVQGDDWKELFDKLPEEVKSVIVDAGLCPDCTSDEEEDEEIEEDETDEEPEVIEPKKKRDIRTPDEVMRKFDRTLDDPDLKEKLKQY